MKKNLIQLLLLLTIGFLLSLFLRLTLKIPPPISGNASLSPFSFPSLTILLFTIFWAYWFVKTRQWSIFILGTLTITYFGYQKFINLQHSWQDLVAGFLLGFLIVFLFKIFYQPKQIWSRLMIDDRFPDPLSPLFGEMIIKTYTRAAQQAQIKLGLTNRNFIPECRLFKNYLYNNFSKSKLPKLKLLKLFINLYQQAISLSEKYNEKIIPEHKNFVNNIKQRLSQLESADQLKLFKEVKEGFTNRMVYEIMIAYLIELVALRFKLILFFLTPRKVKENYDLLSFDLNNDSKIFIEKIEQLVKLKRQSAQGFKQEFDEFVRNYYFRLTNYDFVNPSWEENPELILNIIDNHAQENIKPSKQLYKKFKAQSQLLNKFKEQFLGSDYFNLFKKQFYRWQKLAVQYHLLKKKRYNSRMEYFYLLKKIALNIGQYLEEQKIILQKQDIFFLYFNELEQLIKKPAPVDELVNQRRSEWQDNFKLQAKFKIYDEKDLIRSFQAVKKIKELKGLSANQGKIVGKCKVILNQDQFINFAEGDILITKSTNPSWTPLFTRAKGVITESGGILSHAAIVSREYNLPCIVGIKNVTNILKDGMMIEIDGSKGILKIL